MKPLTNSQLKRAKSLGYDGICPTCRGKGSYQLDGFDHRCECEEQMRLQRHYFGANIGALYHIIHFDDFFDPNLSDIVREYIDGFEDNRYYGRGITFYGELGTGKSFGAAVILKELVKKGFNGYFITFDDLLNVQTQGWNDDSNRDFYEIRNADILVIDELFDGLTAKQKDLLSDTLERIIRYRVANRKPTIITTNLKPDQEAIAYPRISSLLSTSQIRFHALGEDVRKSTVRKLTDERIARGDRKAIV